MLKRVIILIGNIMLSFSIFAVVDQMHTNHHHIMGQSDVSFATDLTQHHAQTGVCPIIGKKEEIKETIYHHKNRAYRFCCPACAKLFEKNPDYYAAKIKHIDLTASQFKFNPKTITVHKDDIVRLTVTSIDVTHGIYIKVYNINVPIKKGEKKIIEFNADKIGKFEIVCSVYCGHGHHQMKGELIVKK